MKKFFAGVKFLGQGFARVIRRPKLVLLGIVPAILSLLLFIGLFVLLFYFLREISTAATWFARDWQANLRNAVQVAASVAIVGVAVLLAVISYTGITLLIGDPFYEAIAQSVE